MSSNLHPSPQPAGRTECAFFTLIELLSSSPSSAATGCIPVGNYAASALAEGVNLAANPNTPMQKQAMKVHDLNYKRMLAEKSLRDIVKMELGAKVAGRDPAKEGELAAYFEDLNGPLKNDYKHVVYRSHMANAQKTLPREAEFRQAVEQSFAALYAANRPVSANPGRVKRLDHSPCPGLAMVGDDRVMRHGGGKRATWNEGVTRSARPRPNGMVWRWQGWAQRGMEGVWSGAYSEAGVKLFLMEAPESQISKASGPPGIAEAARKIFGKFRA